MSATLYDIVGVRLNNDPLPDVLTVEDWIEPGGQGGVTLTMVDGSQQTYHGPYSFTNESPYSWTLIGPVELTMVRRETAAEVAAP